MVRKMREHGVVLVGILGGESGKRTGFAERGEAGTLHYCGFALLWCVGVPLDCGSVMIYILTCVGGWMR